MKIATLEENIYDGKSTNNRINKRKYRKHSMSPFCGMSPNVEKNIEFFNRVNNVGDAPASDAGMNGNGGGEGMGESLQEDYNEELGYDPDVVKNMVEKYQDYLKRDNYTAVFNDLSNDPDWPSEDESDFLNFLYSLDINPLDHMTIILDEMFCGYKFPEVCRNLVLPSKITSVGWAAFCDTNLHSIDMSQTQIVKLSDNCFEDSYSLKSIILPNTLKHIGDSAFLRTGITTMIIPEGVKSIDSGAFIDCSNLTEIELPASLKDIGDDNFNSNGKILTIYAPKGSYAAEWVKETYDFAVAHGRIKLIER